MKWVRYLSLLLAMALLLPTVSFAEGLDVDAAAADAEPVEEAALASEFVLKSGEPVVWLTEKKVSARMNVGEVLQIAVNAGETGKFKSKSTKLAVVDDSGLVTALAKGTVKIEFKPSGGKTRTLTLKIDDPYAPTSVRIAQGSSVTLNVGETLRLDAVLSPDTARTTLQWKSDKSKVASVDADGVVTALTEGKTKLTVTTANKKRATISVKVEDPYKPTSVRFGQGDSVTLNVGDALQLEPVLSPDTARTTFRWKSDKPKIATVDASGVVTAVKVGKTKLTVMTANGKKANIAVNVVNPYQPTGISIAQGGSLTLNVGEGVQLDALLRPDGARTTLKWKTSASKVAAVDSRGYVTAMGKGSAKITATTENGLSAVLEVRVVDVNDQPRNPAMLDASYNGVDFKVVNTPINPMDYWKLVYDNVCTHPGGTDKYEGYCLCFCNYYVSGMVDNLPGADPAIAKKKYRTSKKLSDKTEKYTDPDVMMARLYDLVSAGVPQILMVEALLHKGSRHFVTVVGYRARVTRREDLRPEDLLVIDSFDGKLESMDPAIEPADVRHLFKKSGKYRIDAFKYRE